VRYSIDGLVIRETEAGENDKRITLLTAERGKITVSAKGARSLKSKYMNAIGLFTYGNYEISERQGYAWLGGASVTEAFYPLRDDIDKLALASYIVDVAGELSGADEPAEDILRLTLNTLYAIANDLKPLAQIKAAYELRAMSMSGYMPMLEGCGLCGKEKSQLMYLDVMNGMLKCDECIKKLNSNREISVSEDGAAVIIVPIDYDALSSARYIVEAPMARVLSFVPKERSMEMLSKLAETYLLHHLEKSFASLDFYNSLKK
jgi:DNA repair protein RecO (recombination protein O)